MIQARQYGGVLGCPISVPGRGKRSIKFLFLEGNSTLPTEDNDLKGVCTKDAAASDVTCE